jgi:uncharacterized DUF497 family protein
VNRGCRFRSSDLTRYNLPADDLWKRIEVRLELGRAGRRHDGGRAHGKFEGPTLEGPDDRRNYGERRFGALGMAKGIVVFVVYTWRDRRGRLISARKAGKHEQEIYASRIAALPSAPEEGEQDEG